MSEGLSHYRLRVAFVLAVFVILVGPFLAAIFYPALTGTSPQPVFKEAIYLFYLESYPLTVLVMVAAIWILYRRYRKPPSDES